MTLASEPNRGVTNKVLPQTQYVLRSRTYHQNFTITTGPKPQGTRWQIMSMQIIEFAADFTKESHDPNNGYYYYEIEESRLLIYINEFQKWYGTNDPSTNPGPIEG